MDLGDIHILVYSQSSIWGEQSFFFLVSLVIGSDNTDWCKKRFIMGLALDEKAVCTLSVNALGSTPTLPYRASKNPWLIIKISFHSSYFTLCSKRRWMEEPWTQEEVLTSRRSWLNQTKINEPAVDLHLREIIYLLL